MLFLIPILHQTTTWIHRVVDPYWLFLIPILHQTTTAAVAVPIVIRCFSFQFYIKPQQLQIVFKSGYCCFSFQFYIKPQRVPRSGGLLVGVSHSNSTSNHNYYARPIHVGRLFLIPILHQTTTSRMAVIHILHVTHMTPMHKTSCRTPGKLVGCNFVFQRAIYQKNSSC